MLASGRRPGEPYYDPYGVYAAVEVVVSGASGGTPPSRYWRANFAICANAGAATTPPQIAPRGSSTETRITSRGREAGTTPTNEATERDFELGRTWGGLEGGPGV